MRHFQIQPASYVVKLILKGSADSAQHPELLGFWSSPSSGILRENKREHKIPETYSVELTSITGRHLPKSCVLSVFSITGQWPSAKPRNSERRKLFRCFLIECGIDLNKKK
jgi:hypothetical protein